MANNIPSGTVIMVDVAPVQGNMWSLTYGTYTGGTYTGSTFEFPQPKAHIEDTVTFTLSAAAQNAGFTMEATAQATSTGFSVSPEAVTTQQTSITFTCGLPAVSTQKAAVPNAISIIFTLYQNGKQVNIASADPQLGNDGSSGPWLAA